MKSVKKVIALILTMLLILSVSPVAFAEETADPEAEWFTSFGIKKGSGTLEEAITNCVASGKISLLKDVDADSTLYITKNATIIGNGYSITRSDENAGAIFVINNAATLTFKDVTVDGNETNFPGYVNSLISLTSGGVVLDAGAVLTSNNAKTFNGGAIAANAESLSAKCSITMNEGSKIADCTGNSAGAVYLGSNASMTINGGTIEKCKALYDGGAVVVATATSKLAVNNGTITGCEASTDYTGFTGSAIYAPYGTVNLASAKITKNTNKSDFGAIFFSSATVFAISGDTYVYDNEGSAGQSNIFVPAHASIIVESDFTENAKIGVTIPSYISATNEVDMSFINTDQDIMGYVFNDADGKTFCNIDGTITLIKCIYVSFDAGNGNCSVKSKLYPVDKAYGELPECDYRDGFDFLGWYTEDGELVTEDTILSADEDITLYASWENLNKLDTNPMAVIGRFFERIGDLMRIVFEFLESFFRGSGNDDLAEIK